jgi:phosphohistidine phosphatase
MTSTSAPPSLQGEEVFAVLERSRPNMRLYFLRHGIAAERDEWRGAEFDRPLTEKGRERMGREVTKMVELALALDVIVTSPLVRARQTAEIVAAGLDRRENLVEDERVGLDFDPGRLAGILREHPRANAIMLVGHEPSMSETIGELVGAARIDLKKGGLACVDLPNPSALEGTLLWLIPPKMLAR